jgi:hypothetical protein
VDIGTKALWFVIILGIVTIVIVAVIKVGDVVVRRRTAALLAAHGDEPEGSKGTEDQEPRP